MNKTDSMRIPPIGHDQWTDDIRDTLTSFMEPFGKLGLNGNESEKDSLSPVLSTVLQHPPLAKMFFPFARYLLLETTLEPRALELLTLRISWLCRSEFEWAQHSMMAINNGIFTEEDIDRIAQGADAGGWNEADAMLLRAVDQLREKNNMDDATWTSLSQHFSRQQVMDIVFLVGGYTLIGMYVNTFGVPLKEGMKGF